MLIRRLIVVACASAVMTFGLVRGVWAEERPSTPSYKPKFSGPASPEVDQSVRVVNIATQGDSVAFDRTVLKVMANSRVRLIFKNTASLDSEIQHDVVVLKPGTQDGFLKRLADSGYDFSKLANDPAVVGASKAIDPQTRGEVVFDVGASGEYHYVCTMPGHADIMQMRGVIKVVEE